MSHLNDIIEACKRGERLAQRQLYEQYKGKLFAVCLRYAHSRQDAEDMLQEGFIRIFTDLHQYGNKGSLEGWMRKVVVNVALQFLRRQKRQPFTEEPGNWDLVDLPDEEEDPAFREEMVQIVLKYLQQMPTGFRTVLNLYVLEGYSHEEIAQTLDISVGTSKSQLSRAKDFLKNMLAKSLTN